MNTNLKSVASLFPATNPDGGLFFKYDEFYCSTLVKSTHIWWWVAMSKNRIRWNGSNAFNVVIGHNIGDEQIDLIGSKEATRTSMAT
jgi:hypothetical protein